MCQSVKDGGLRCKGHLNEKLQKNYVNFVNELNGNDIQIDDNEQYSFEGEIAVLKMRNKNTTLTTTHFKKAYPDFDPTKPLSRQKLDDEDRLDLLMNTTAGMEFRNIIKNTKDPAKKNKCIELFSEALDNELKVAKYGEYLYNDKDFVAYEEARKEDPDNKNIKEEFLKKHFSLANTYVEYAEHLVLNHEILKLLSEKRNKKLTFSTVKKDAKISELDTRMQEKILTDQANESINQKNARFLLMSESINKIENNVTSEPKKYSVKEAYELAKQSDVKTEKTKKFIISVEEQKIAALIKKEPIVKDFIRLINAQKHNNIALEKRIDNKGLSTLANSYLGNGKFKKPLFASASYKNATQQFSKIINLYPEGFKAILGK